MIDCVILLTFVGPLGALLVFIPWGVILGSLIDSQKGMPVGVARWALVWAVSPAAALIVGVCAGVFSVFRGVLSLAKVAELDMLFPSGRQEKGGGQISHLKD